MWEKYYSLVPLKLWNCNPPIIRGKMLALALKGKTVKENLRLLSYVYSWLNASNENTNSSRSGHLTLAIVAQRVRKAVRTTFPSSSLDCSNPDLGVQRLSLSFNEGQQQLTYSGNELWEDIRPQTLQDTESFVGRVAKIKGFWVNSCSCS